MLEWILLATCATIIALGFCKKDEETMPNKTKNPRKAGEKANQAGRSNRNKARRVARTKNLSRKHKNAAHIESLKAKRIARLNKLSGHVAKDRQSKIDARLKELAS